MKVADVAPTYCSSCHAQNTDRVHVDLEAAWDGPVLNEGTQDAPTFVAIDDLILCQECLAEAGALVGLGDTSAAAALVEELEGRVRELAERLAGAVDHIGKLEQAASSREALASRLAPAGRQQGQAPRRQLKKPQAVA